MKIINDFFLIYQLSVKELKVKYKNATLGFLWTLIVPLIMMMVFMVVFKYFFKMHLSPIFLLLGLFPWTYTTNCINASTTAFVDNMSILKKIYFPRYYIIISIILANIVSFFISFLILIPFGINFSFYNFLIIIPFIFQIIFTFGLCLIFSSLFVYFRDIKYFVEILLMVWFYLTPIFYKQTLLLNISKKALYIFLLNPMSGIIVMYRDFLINDTMTNLKLMSLTSFTCLLFFIIGFLIFRRLQGNFIDYA